jgi:hypothetical protein
MLASGQHGCNTLTSLSCNDNRSGQHGCNTLPLYQVVKVSQPCWPDLLSLHDREVKVLQPCWLDLLSLHDREVKVYRAGQHG